MVFLVVAEALVPSGSVPGPLELRRMLRGRLARARRYSQISRIAVRHGLGPYLRGQRRAELDTPDGREAADGVIGMDAVNGELGPDFAALECPTVYVVGTGAHSGATEEEMRTMRAAAAEAEASNKRVSVFATTPYNHMQILNRAPDIVVAAIEDVIHRSS
jgi:hypothetical protein